MKLEIAAERGNVKTTLVRPLRMCSFSERVWKKVQEAVAQEIETSERTVGDVPAVDLTITFTPK